LNDFVAGMKILLAPGGTITMEFPHLQRLVEGNQFDTIYHEHFSYSLVAVSACSRRRAAFDVERCPPTAAPAIYARHAAALPKGQRRAPWRGGASAGLRGRLRALASRCATAPLPAF
jgi:hypothetical protein